MNTSINTPNSTSEHAQGYSDLAQWFLWLGFFGLGMLATFLSASMWPFWLGYSALMMFILNRACHNLALAFALTIFMELVVIQWCMIIGPFSGLTFEVSVGVGLFLLLVLAGAVSLYRAKRERQIPRALTTGSIPFGLLAVPAFFVTMAVFVRELIRPGSISWAMFGDAQLNTVAARMIAETGGQNLELNPIISLPQGLMALAHRFVSPTADESMRLIHEVSGQIEVLTIITGLSSLGIGLLAFSLLDTFRRIPRITLSLVLSLFPYLWFLTGNAISFGFYNVPVIFLVLVLTLIVWTSAYVRPIFGTVGLLLGATIALGSWAPLAIAPVSLGFILLVKNFRSGLTKSSPSFSKISLVAVTLQFFLFFLAGVFPGYLREGSNLAQPGGIFGLNPAIVLLVWGLALLLAASPNNASSELKWNFVIAPLALVASSAAGLIFLIWQGRMNANPWTYYPIKYSWITISTIGVLVAVMLARISNDLASRWRRALAFGASLVISASLVLSTLPANLGLSGFFPFAGQIIQGGSFDYLSGEVSRHETTKTIYYKFDNKDGDFFLNQWMFQTGAPTTKEPIRSYAYRSVNTPEAVCEAAQVWGGAVTVVSSSYAGLVVAERCPELVKIEIRKAPEK